MYMTCYCICRWFWQDTSAALSLYQMHLRNKYSLFLLRFTKLNSLFSTTRCMWLLSVERYAYIKHRRLFWKCALSLSLVHWFNACITGHGSPTWAVLKAHGPWTRVVWIALKFGGDGWVLAHCAMPRGSVHEFLQYELLFNIETPLWMTPKSCPYRWATCSKHYVGV